MGDVGGTLPDLRAGRIGPEKLFEPCLGLLWEWGRAGNGGADGFQRVLLVQRGHDDGDCHGRDDGQFGDLVFLDRAEELFEVEAPEDVR